MSIFDSLYAQGAETAASAAAPGTITAAHAIAAIKTADRVASQIHRDICARATPRFQRYWGQFYNEWLTYRTLNSEREAQADPARVLNDELPKFTRRLYDWRDLLARECGTAVGQSAPPPAQKTDGGFPWRPVLVLGGIVVVGSLARAWWASRMREREEFVRQQLAAENARAAAQSALPIQYVGHQMLPQQPVYLPASPPMVMPAPSYPYAYVGQQVVR